MDTTVRRAGRDDAARVAEVLASAFSRDPVWSWVLGGEPGDRRMVPFFRSLLGPVLRRHDAEVHVTADGSAATIWFPPQRWRLTPLEQLRGAPLALRTLRSGLRRGLAVESAVHGAHPDEPHQYLEYLGAHVSAQGTGRGSALLADMTVRLDRDRLPAYLENSNPRNTPLYERHGFRVRGRIDVPAGCPPLLPMWREPA